MLGENDAYRADQLNLLHPRGLIELIEKQIPEAIVFSKGRGEFNMGWQVPAYHPLPEEHRKHFQTFLESKYRLAWKGHWLLVYLPSRT